MSTLSNNDYIQIVSTFMTMSNTNYRCQDCRLKYKNDKVKREKLESNMACRGLVKQARHEYRPENINVGNPKIKYYNCVGNHYYGEWAGFINMAPKYEQGILPYPGSLLDQPAKFVEVMDLVHNLMREKQLQEEQAATKQRNVSGRRSSKR